MDEIRCLGFALFFGLAVAACGGDNGADDTGSGNLSNGEDENTESSSEPLSMEGVWAGRLQGDDGSQQTVILTFEGDDLLWRTFDDGGTIAGSVEDGLTELTLSSMGDCVLVVTGVVEPGNGAQVHFYGSFESSPGCSDRHSSSGNISLLTYGPLAPFGDDFSGTWSLSITSDLPFSSRRHSSHAEEAAVAAEMGAKTIR